MSTTIYPINRGINKPIEFKGLKAQYVWYLGGGIVCLLIIFALLYIFGVPSIICLLVIALSGAVLFRHVYHLSKEYGQYGLMKRSAKRRTPPIVKIYSLNTIRQL